MSNQVKLLLVVILGISIVLIVIQLISKAGQTMQQKIEIPQDRTLPTPRETPQFPTASPVTAPAVEFSKEGSDKLLEIVRTRPPLEAEDQTAKRELLISLGNKSGVLSKAANYQLEYVKAADVFQVEILSEDINKAKVDALAWLKEKGLSSNGLCKLPVTFYLNYNIAQNLRGSGLVFNPIPEGCE